ncbi:MAG: hypothetical protein Q9169_007585 [Polycauliona sp. 2 TL-2023]
MRTFSVPTWLALGLAVRQTAATWNDAQIYSNPSNTNNQCVGDQSKGLSFDDHSDGDLGNYGALNWENMKCTDGLQKRTFGPEDESHDKTPNGFLGGKCASGVARKDVDTSPKFSCGSEQKGMSIDLIHVSTSEKTEIELHYGYGNGVICKQKESCSPAGKIIKNHQCGDAKTVVVKLPDADTKDKCEIGIHSVGFNCGPASSQPSVPSSTPVESNPMESSPVVSTSQETKPYPYPTANTTTLVGSTAPATVPEMTSIPSTSIADLPIPSTSLDFPTTSTYPNTSISSTSPVETMPTITSVSSTGPVETIPTTTASGTTVPLVTTEVYVMFKFFKLIDRDNFDNMPGYQYCYHILTTLTTCPVTNTITLGDTTSVQTITTVSTITSTSISTICTQCAPPVDTFVSPPAIPTPSSPPAVTTPVVLPSTPAQAPPAQYPNVLPNCMKTWITITTCKDTTDSSCYCLDAAFTKTVQECVSAWAANSNDVQGALSNLAGICADHVSNNPGIITNVPITITLVPTPASQAPSGPSSAPMTTPALTSPVPSNGGSPPVVDTSGASTVANSPVGATDAPSVANPVTTLSLSQAVPYACPVSQLPDGQPQAPVSSCSSMLVTQVIVPQVGFETAPAAPGVTNPSVDLVAGSPASNPAVTTAGPVAGGNPATTFGTVVGSASAIASTFPQEPITPFTGGASGIKVTGFGLLAGVLGMLLVI